MHPDRHHPHPLGGIRLILLYVFVVASIALLATLAQHGG